MAEPLGGGSSNATEAFEFFKTWLAHGAKPAEFKEQWEARSGLREDLARFQAAYELGQAAVSSRSFHEVLGEAFAEAETLTVTVEEAPAGEPKNTILASAENQSQYSPGGSRYVLQEEVARGGMGVIWRVRDRDLGRTLAMKIMSASSTEDPFKEPAKGTPGGGEPGQTDPRVRLALARFVEEAQVTGQLDHPGIVPIYEAGFDDQRRPFFTMKLVKGRNLSEIFKLARAEEEGWNLPRVVGVLVKACQALAFAHSKGVIHRDLKPANIMVGRFGEVYLMDWGLAKITGKKDLHDIRLRDQSAASASLHSPRLDAADNTADSPLITMDGSVVGTPAYMSPEQAAGLIEEVDKGSDTYSLGAILYDLLAGQPPYVEPRSRLSPHTILARVLDGPPRRLELLNPEAPPQLIAICDKAMSRDKARRYASSLELAEDLQAFLDHRVVRAYRTGPVAEFRSWMARNRMTAVVASAAILFIMAMLGFGAAWERSKATRLRESLARQYLHRGQSLCANGQMARGLHWLARGLREASPGSKALQDVIRQNLATWAQRWNPPDAVFLHESMVTDFAMSPDSQRAVTFTVDGEVDFWSAETGNKLNVSLPTNVVVHEVGFSPDGKLFVTSSDDGIRIWDAVTVEFLAKTEALSDGAPLLDVTQDSQKLVTGEHGSGAVRLWVTKSGAPLGKTGQHERGVTSVRFSPDGHFVVSTSWDATARLWDGTTGEPVGPPMRHPASVRFAVFSPEGERIATACEDGTARLWSARDGKPIGKVMLLQGTYDLDFSPDGQRLLTIVDTAVRAWNGGTGEPIGPLFKSDKGVNFARFARGGSQIAVGLEQGAVVFVHAKKGRVLGRPAQIAEGRSRCSLAANDQALLLSSVSASPAVGLWRGKSETNATPSEPLSCKVTSSRAVAVSRDGRKVMVADNGGQLWWWYPESGMSIKTGIPRQAAPWCANLSADGKHALTGNYSSARLWSLDPPEKLLIDLPHAEGVRAVVFSPDESLIATASFDHTARLWSTNGSPASPPLVHPNLVEDVAFSPDGRLLATACGDGIARLWPVKGTSRSPVGLPMRHRGSILAVKFSPNGKIIATGSRDKTVRFWDGATGRPLGLVLEHVSSIEDLCFSPDGRLLATASQEEGVHIWSVEAGELLGPALYNSIPAWQVVFSQDGSRIAVGSDTAPARIWALAAPFSGDLGQAELWIQVLTWQEMDEQGALSWLDRPAWNARQAKLPDGFRRPAKQPNGE